MLEGLELAGNKGVQHRQHLKFIRVEIGGCAVHISKGLEEHLDMYHGLNMGLLIANPESENYNPFNMMLFATTSTKKTRKVHPCGRNALKITNADFVRKVTSVIPTSKSSIRMYIREGVFFFEEYNGKMEKIYPLFQEEFLFMELPGLRELYHKYENYIMTEFKNRGDAHGKKC